MAASTPPDSVWRRPVWRSNQTRSKRRTSLLNATFIQVLFKLLQGFPQPPAHFVLEPPDRSLIAVVNSQLGIILVHVNMPARMVGTGELQDVAFNLFSQTAEKTGGDKPRPTSPYIRQFQIRKPCAPRAHCLLPTANRLLLTRSKQWAVSS